MLISPLIAAKATLALNSGLCNRLFLLIRYSLQINGERRLRHFKAAQRLGMATSGKDNNLVLSVLAGVESLFTNGPAGGGGVRANVTRRIATSTAYTPESLLPQQLISTQKNIDPSELRHIGE